MGSPDDLIGEKPERPRGGESSDDGNQTGGGLRGIKNAGGVDKGRRMRKAGSNDPSADG